MMKIYKHGFLVAILSCSIMLPVQSSFAADGIIKETQSHNVFKGALLSIWARFKSFNPHARQDAKSHAVYTAGIRGAESTGTLLQPVWKDDLTQDKKFQKELKDYGQALTHLDNGNLKQASSSLGTFLKDYSSSVLKPNALFAQGISYAGLGDNTNSIKSLSQFSTDFPNHPLFGDAEALLAQLK